MQDRMIFNKKSMYIVTQREITKIIPSYRQPHQIFYAHARDGFSLNEKTHAEQNKFTGKRFLLLGLFQTGQKAS